MLDTLAARYCTSNREGLSNSRVVETLRHAARFTRCQPLSDEMPPDKWEQQRIAAAHLRYAGSVGIVGPVEDVLPVMDPAYEPSAVFGREQQIAVAAADPQQLLALEAFRHHCLFVS